MLPAKRSAPFLGMSNYGYPEIDKQFFGPLFTRYVTDTIMDHLQLLVNYCIESGADRITIERAIKSFEDHVKFKGLVVKKPKGTKVGEAVPMRRRQESESIFMPRAPEQVAMFEQVRGPEAPSWGLGHMDKNREWYPNVSATHTPAPAAPNVQQRETVPFSDFQLEGLGDVRVYESIVLDKGYILIKCQDGFYAMTNDDTEVPIRELTEEEIEWIGQLPLDF
jgi:hypothetical protein